MLRFKDLSINSKLTMIIVLACAATLVLAGSAAVTAELMTSRRAMEQDMAVLADLLGRNSTAPLLFHREEDAEEVTKTLSALVTDSQIMSARIYDKEGKPFADYHRTAADTSPGQPPVEGSQFTRDSLELFRPIEEDHKAVGGIYLRANLERIHQRVALHAGLIGAVLLLALAATLGLAPWLRRPVSQPIMVLADIARNIAESKNYSIRAPRRGRDEIGRLTDAFNQMLDKIETTQTSLRTSNETLQMQAREMSESIAILVRSANAILSTSIQFSSDAAQAASAVGEATTTVEEVRRAAESSNERAHSVAHNARDVMQTALLGKKSTEEMIDGVQRIREEITAIADSMLRLTGQTQAIGEIIAAVEDFAVQSNLLAVNASVEAARAGEHGKGFSVVAYQIRELARQSKEATNRVRVILRDIQHAANAAALATERGGKSTETGVKQSDVAGKSIQVLSDSVTQSTTDAIQIAAACQQQLIDMDQVTSAMDCIREASSRNAANAKEIENAALNLTRLSDKLKESAKIRQCAFNLAA